MVNYIHHRVKMLLEETSHAYATCANINTDYAAFASQALPEFKRALRKPQLTSVQLRDILRKGMMRHRALKPDASWSTFLADHIESASNGR